MNVFQKLSFALTVLFPGLAWVFPIDYQELATNIPRLQEWVAFICFHSKPLHLLNPQKMYVVSTVTLSAAYMFFVFVPVSIIYVVSTSIGPTASAKTVRTDQKNTVGTSPPRELPWILRRPAAAFHRVHSAWHLRTVQELLMLGFAYWVFEGTAGSEFYESAVVAVLYVLGTWWFLFIIFELFAHITFGGVGKRTIRE